MEASQILLVEDEADIAGPIREGFVDEGFDVAWASTGRAAIQALDSRTFDAIIVDLMLPELSGEAVLRYLKARGNAPPVLVLSARSRLEDKLALFREGCDDYLTKPFIFVELLERTKALLRRASRSLDEKTQFEDLKLDYSSFSLSTKDETVSLTPKEAAICRLLMNPPGRVISRKEIIQGVWGLKDEPSSNLVGIHVFKLRRKFAELGREDWFETVRSAGFRLRKSEVLPRGS